jgi:hypothetical protein
VLNLKLHVCVIKVAKCKQSGILTSIYKILFHYDFIYCQKAPEAQDGSGNWPTIKFLETIKVHKKIKSF